MGIGAIHANGDYLYIGAGQKGLLRYNLISETTSQVGDSNENCTDITLGTRSFFASNYEGGIIEDAEKNVWVSTREGLLILPPQKFLKDPLILSVDSNAEDLNSLSSENLRSILRTIRAKYGF